MSSGHTRTIQYASSWCRGRARVEEREVSVFRDQKEVSATVVLPGRGKPPFPTWIALHGISRPGRAHLQLRRFVSALASSGAVVIVPEVPEWRDLSLAPELALPTVRGALQALQGVPEAAEGRVGLAGFSFGCPQAILAGSDPSVRDSVACVVGFGGFCDLERTIRFQLTGVHEWEGVSERLRADPYGRWIVGANHLTSAPGFEDADDVRSALYRLACEAGDRQAPLDTPFFHTFAAELRAEIAAERQPLFDLFVHPGQPDPDPEEVEELVQGMLVAARSESPLLDPANQLKGVTRPARLIHGRRDHLLPYTETLRLAASLPSHLVADLVITRLLAHSKDDQPPNLAATLREIVEFYDAIRGMLTAV